MFIIPLLAIFAAAYAGTNLATMLNWSKRDVVIGKIMLGALFLGLAILMLALGEQYGGKVWSLLDDDEVRELSVAETELFGS